MIFHARPRFTKDIDIFVKADPANERQPGEKRMHRRELIRRMVLNAICDDFENVDQIILPVIARDCGKLGLVVERPEVLSALALLVEDGMAKVYDLQNLKKGDPFSGELRSMPPLDQVEENFKTYFYITEKGKELHLSDDAWWPFDDDGELRPGRHPDQRPASD